MKKQGMILGAAVAAVGSAGAADAVNIVVDDFDGGGQFVTRVISPDNTSNNGAFPSSGFDVFGITDCTVSFDFADDSAGSFAGDTFGMVPTAKTDKFFGTSDVDNGDNPGGGTVTWTVDVTGLTDISISALFSAMGDFEAGDNSYTFTAQIDAGPVQNVFLIDANNDADFTYTLRGRRDEQP